MLSNYNINFGKWGVWSAPALMAKIEGPHLQMHPSPHTHPQTNKITCVAVNGVVPNADTYNHLGRLEAGSIPAKFYTWGKKKIHF